MDERMASCRRIEQLACWWAQATQEARYEVLKRATLTNTPELAEVQLAALLAESEAGTVSEG